MRRIKLMLHNIGCCINILYMYMFIYMDKCYHMTGLMLSGGLLDFAGGSVDL